MQSDAISFVFGRSKQRTYGQANCDLKKILWDINNELFAADKLHRKAGHIARSLATETGDASGSAGWSGKPGPKSVDQPSADRPGTSADDDMTERIRARAWQAAGSPENCADEFWYAAQTQVRAGVVPLKSGRS